MRILQRSTPVRGGTNERRLITHGLDKALLDKTVALAKARGGFGWQHLRAALDTLNLRRIAAVTKLQRVARLPKAA